MKSPLKALTELATCEIDKLGGSTPAKHAAGMMMLFYWMGQKHLGETLQRYDETDKFPLQDLQELLDKTRELDTITESHKRLSAWITSQQNQY